MFNRGYSENQLTIRSETKPHSFLIPSIKVNSTVGGWGGWFIQFSDLKSNLLFQWPHLSLLPRVPSTPCELPLLSWVAPFTGSITDLSSVKSVISPCLLSSFQKFQYPFSTVVFFSGIYVLIFVLFLHYAIRALEEPEINLCLICYTGNQLKLKLILKCQASKLRPHYLLTDLPNSDCLLVWIKCILSVGQECALLSRPFWLSAYTASFYDALETVKSPLHLEGHI